MQIDLDFGSTPQTSSTPAAISSPLFTIPSEMLMQEPLEPSPAPATHSERPQSAPTPASCPLCDKPLYFMDDTMINTHIDLCLKERSKDHTQTAPLSSASTNFQVTFAFHETQSELLNPNPMGPLMQAQQYW